MYETITWLAGRTFIDKEFVGRIDAEGLDAVLKDCPYDDLTDGQRATFEATFHDETMRLVEELWWAIYKLQRAKGVIPDAAIESSPWEP